MLAGMGRRGGEKCALILKAFSELKLEEKCKIPTSTKCWWKRKWLGGKMAILFP